MSYNYLIKLLLIGDSRVGKSSILERFIDDKFSGNMISTIGIDFKTTTLDVCDKKVKLQIWDTAGQERFRCITQAYYRGARGIILVYDILEYKSYTNVAYWLKQIRETNNTASIIIVGNKCDKAANRVVAKADAQAYAAEHHAFYVETSALDGTCINQLFDTITREILSTLDASIFSSQSIVPINPEQKQLTQSTCCGTY